MNNKKKILIPGGTGFLGYHLCVFFKKKGWIVHSISKFKPQKKRKIKGVKYILCDVSNKKILNKKIDKFYDYTANLSGYVDHSKNKSIIQSHLLCKIYYKYLKVEELENLCKLVQVLNMEIKIASSRK